MIKPGYKHTELGWIPDEWEVKNLNECCLNRGDYGINAPAVEFSKNLPLYLRITDIDDNGRFIKNANKSVDSLASKDFFLQEGDIVFARTGSTTGKTYLYNKDDGKLVFAGFLIRFKPNQDLLISYFLKLFTDTKPYWNWVKTMSSRSGQPGINSVEYGSLQISLPPLLEQKSIAKILSTWDKAIKTTENLILAKSKLKQGLIQKLLTGKLRFKEFRNDNWAIVKINKCSKQIIKKNITNENHVVLSCTKYNGLVDSLEYFGRQMFSNDLSTYKVVKKGQFAYATNHIEEGSIGYQNIYNYALISPMYTVFETNQEIDDNFLYAVLKTEQYRKIFESNTSGSINRRGGLRWEDFSNITIPKPSLQEQKKIASLVSLNIKEIDFLNKQLTAIKEQKKGLMQKLLTGEVRVKV